MTSTFRSIAAWAFALLAVLALSASIARSGTVAIQFNSALGTNYGGEYTGIYYGTVNGTAASFVCDDFDDSIGNGQSWQANVGTSYPVSGTVQYNPNVPFFGTFAEDFDLTQQQDYNAVSYLANQIFADPTGSQVNADSWAIWSLNSSVAFNDVAAGASAGDSTYLQAWNDLFAAQRADNASNGSLYVYTPVPQGAGQEFLAQTPEPASMALFGTFLLMAGAFLKRFARG